jgi:hypothetical protein
VELTAREARKEGAEAERIRLRVVGEELHAANLHRLPQFANRLLERAGGPGAVLGG